ncbi:hypothetical protein AOG54_07680 [Acidiplasma aeolicum]|uniref:Ketol-acid reductoisomerase n=1 Tax=Acidiplasma aeolicum TaxID=507754 RepID=A0A0N8VLE3_9ARCH|nr:hypothetical protein AOG54_07680 [Acidiplasma aeolicum]
MTKLDNKDYFSEIGNKIIGIIGYGNQGKSQALNLRDSGLNVIVGNVNDNYAKDAEKDGFKVYDIPEAVKKSDIIFLLIPDEIQKNIYKNHIEPNIKIGATLVFASGYNYFYGFIRPRSDITVLMIAPRMIGWGVRDVYVNDQGFPSLVAVGQDPNNNGYSILMTLCDRLGMFRKGGCAVLSSFKEETLVDLLSEHSWVGVMLYSFRAYYDVATELGASPASVILELYASGELAEIAKSMRDMGLFNQLKTHSRTSQYGQLTRGPLYITDEFKKTLKNEAINILNGTFAREWNDEENNGYIVYNRLHEMAKEHPMETEERKLYKILGR